MQSTRQDRTTRPLFRSGLRARTVASLALLGVAAACDVHGPSAPGALASISVTPNATMTTSTPQQMIAIGYDAEGRVVTIAPVWSIAGSGGTVSVGGLFTSGTVAGVYTNAVVATVGTIVGHATIVVVPGALATISLAPSPLSLDATTTQQFIAVGKDSWGNIVQLAPSWSILAGGGTISTSGLFTAGATPGIYENTVQVSDGGIKAYATVSVTTAP